MKKVLTISVGLMLVAGIALAGWNIDKKASFVTTGDSGAVTIDKGNGTIVNTQMAVYQETNKTVSIYCPSIQASEYVAEVSGTAIALYTSVSNKVDGYTLTTSDYLLCHNDTSGWQLTGISAIGAVSTNSSGHVIATAYTASSAVTLDAKDPVFICKSADILTYAGITAGTIKVVESAFTSKGEMPVHIAYPAGAGASSHVTGTYSVEK